ncbi:MAG: Holliday junction branch migration protein RuvA [Candidatus Bipolaricaulota bacterium]
MIDAITGRVTRLGNDHLVVENAGIAYRIFSPVRALSSYRKGEEVLVYVHLLVREDRILLFGFPSFEERELFRVLLPVSQVGPRLALQMLGAFSPERLVQVVQEGDIDQLMRIKGVGRKTAQRILVELGDKIGDKVDITPVVLPLSDKEEVALRALTSRTLGFSVSEARRALARLRGEDLPVEGLVRRALEIIGS